MKRITIIGCGGAGGHLARMLCQQHRLILIDGDTVEGKNLDRQMFSPDDVGLSKTTALSNTLRRLPRCKKMHPVTDYFTTDAVLPGIRPDCLMVAVDNHRARAAALHWADRKHVSVISCANEEYSAGSWIYLAAWKGTMKDPRVKWPDINLDNAGGDPLMPHCHELVASGEQSPWANMAAACMAVGLFQTWIVDDIVHADEEIQNLVPHYVDAAGSTWRSYCDKPTTAQ